MSRGSLRQALQGVGRREAALAALLLCAAFTSCGGTDEVVLASSPEPALAIVGSSSLSVEGTRGGPFQFGEHMVLLRNRGDARADWRLLADQPWLEVPEPRGSLAPGAEAQVPVLLDQAVAAGLDSAAHLANLRFQNLQHPDEVLTLPFTLIVYPVAGTFEVVQAPEFEPIVNEDAVAETDSTAIWSFENRGELAQRVTIRISEPWLEIPGRSRHVVAPGEALDLEVGIDVWAASREEVGRHAGLVQFLDSATGEVLYEQTVVLAVNAGTQILNGWTVLERHPDSLYVFVSSSEGDDANDGLSKDTPKATIEAGKALMRHGFPDYLLLKRGDTFFESLGQWKTSGRSESEMQFVSTYGNSALRPELRTGAGPGLVTHGGGGSPPTIDHVGFVGLQFTAHLHTGQGQPVGMAFHRPSTNLLVEDCFIEKYNTGMVIQAIGGRHEDVRVRRSVVCDSFGVNDGNPQGLYAVNVDGLLIEECLFDTNGWQPDIPGATADIFSHNVYIDTDNSAVTVRGNVVANGASHGVQMRAGGDCRQNLFIRNSIALMMAGGSGPQQDQALAIRNVIVDGKNIDDQNPRGWGIDFNDVVGGTIRKNVIANNGTVGLPISILLGGGGFGNGVHNVEVCENVVWDWGGSVWFTGESDELTGIDFSGNTIQNSLTTDYLVDHFTLSNHASVMSEDNRFFNLVANTDRWMHQAGIEQSVDEWKMDVGDMSSEAEMVQFVDVQRSAADYNFLQGGTADYDDFILQLRSQSKNRWRREYSARAINVWFREGFEE